MPMDGLKTFKTIEDNKTGIETMIKNDMDCVDAEFVREVGLCCSILHRIWDIE